MQHEAVGRRSVVSSTHLDLFCQGDDIRLIQITDDFHIDLHCTIFQRLAGWAQIATVRLGL
jgi:hypothetical protein